MFVALIGLQPINQAVILNQQLNLNWSCSTYFTKRLLVETPLFLITHLASVIYRLLSRSPLLPLALLPGNLCG